MGLKALAEFLNGLGTGVVVALVMVGGITQDKVPDLLVFHALQADVDPQLAGKADGGLHHHLCVLIFQDVQDKALVDLQTVHRKITDQIQRGNASTEVIQ